MNNMNYSKINFTRWRVATMDVRIPTLIVPIVEPGLHKVCKHVPTYADKDTATMYLYHYLGMVSDILYMGTHQSALRKIYIPVPEMFLVDGCSELGEYDVSSIDIMAIRSLFLSANDLYSERWMASRLFAYKCWTYAPTLVSICEAAFTLYQELTADADTYKDVCMVITSLAKCDQWMECYYPSIRLL